MEQRYVCTMFMATINFSLAELWLLIEGGSWGGFISAWIACVATQNDCHMEDMYMRAVLQIIEKISGHTTVELN